MKLKQMIKNWRLHRQKLMRIKKAERLAKWSGRKYYVFLISGKFYIMDRRGIKVFIKSNKIYHKTDIVSLERLAVYTTASQYSSKLRVKNYKLKQ